DIPLPLLIRVIENRRRHGRRVQFTVRRRLDRQLHVTACDGHQSPPSFTSLTMSGTPTALIRASSSLRVYGVSASRHGTTRPRSGTSCSPLLVTRSGSGRIHSIGCS